MPSSSVVSVGVVVNPSSGRDIRRLLAWASVFPAAEKVNIVLRMLAAMGALGVQEAWMPPDAAGIAARVREDAALAQAGRGLPMPRVRLLEMQVRDDAEDSRLAADLMARRGVRLIAVLGGDGTHRAVAAGCGGVPLAAISTGTNNAFPAWRESTLVGIAAALVATGRVDDGTGLRRNKRLRLTGVLGGAAVDEIALVELCLSHQLARGSGAVWDGGEIAELYAAFAEPGAIGLSSIAGLLLPVSRNEPGGVHLRFGPGRAVIAPILPGGLARVEVASATRFEAGRTLRLPPLRGTAVLDGERLLELDPADRLQLELDFEGPRTIAVDEVLAQAARCGLLVEGGRGAWRA